MLVYTCWHDINVFSRITAPIFYEPMTFLSSYHFHGHNNSKLCWLYLDFRLLAGRAGGVGLLSGFILSGGSTMELNYISMLLYH